MKRFLAVLVFLALVIAPAAQAAVVFTPTLVYNGMSVKIIKIAAVGTSDGAATDALTISLSGYPTIFNAIQETYLYSATLIPGTGTAPDAADLTVQQYIGGSTAVVEMFGSNGTNALHATDTYTVYPIFTSGSSVNGYYPITGGIIVDTENQATGSATWDIYLTFVR